MIKPRNLYLVFDVVSSRIGADFFAVLHWNHGALYAPSDFQNEANFINVLSTKNLRFSGNHISGSPEVTVTGTGD